MADASSIIKVSIIGDAKKLTGALDKADGGLKGFAKKAGGAPSAAWSAVDKALRVRPGRHPETDRLGDAITRLNIRSARPTPRSCRTRPAPSTTSACRRRTSWSSAPTSPTWRPTPGSRPRSSPTSATTWRRRRRRCRSLDDSDAAGNVDLITKAAKGNAKAMQALGINICDADVELRALADTGKTTAKSPDRWREGDGPAQHRPRRP